MFDAFGPLIRSQVGVLEHLWHAASELVSVKAVPFKLDEARADLASRRMSYAGEAVSVRRLFNSSKIVKVWPKVGEAAVCPIVDFIDPHLAAELQNPRGCLRPVEDWPKQTPRSRVFFPTIASGSPRCELRMSVA